MRTFRLTNPTTLLLFAVAALLSAFAPGPFSLGGTALAQNFRVSDYAHDYVTLSWEIPRNRSITNFVVQEYKADGSSSHLISGPAIISTVTSRALDPDTQYRYVLTFKDDSGTTIIEDSVSVRTKPDPDSEPPPPDPDPPTDPDPPPTDPDPPPTDPDPPPTDPDPPPTDPDPPVTGELPTDDPPTKFWISRYAHDYVALEWEMPENRGITNAAVQEYEADGSSSLLISGPAIIIDNVTSRALDPDTQYRYVLTLKDDSGTTIIEKSLSVRTKPAPDPNAQTPDPSDPTDARLSSLSLSGIDLTLEEDDLLRPADWNPHEASAPEHLTETTVSATVNHRGASYVVKLGGVVDDDGVIPLRMGVSVITVVVTAEDGVTTRIYTVRVTRGTAGTPPPNPNTPVTGELPTDDPPVNFRVAGVGHDYISLSWEIPQNRGITNDILIRYRYEADGSYSPDYRFEGPERLGLSHHLGDRHLEPDTQYRYTLWLKDDSETTIIETSLSARTLPAPDPSVPTDESLPPGPNNPTGETSPTDPKPTVKLRGIFARHNPIHENDGQATTITLIVELKQTARTDETITLAIVSPTKGKTAQRGEDFDAIMDETITIAQGRIEGTAQLILTPKDNTEADGDKFFAVQATSSSGNQALTNIKIDDDEMDDSEDDSEDDESFAFVAAVKDQAYTVGTAITALELPEAISGEGEITYRVSALPAGLSFDAATQTISGTPEAATEGAVEVTYTAQDSAGAAISLTFSIAVNPPLNFDDLFDLFELFDLLDDEDGGG